MLQRAPEQYLPTRRNIQRCLVNPQQKPAARGAARDPLTLSSFPPLQPPPDGQLATPCPSITPGFQATVKNLLQKDNGSPGSPFTPGEKGLCVQSDKWTVPSWRRSAGCSRSAAGGQPFVSLWADGAEVGLGVLASHHRSVWGLPWQCWSPGFQHSPLLAELGASLAVGAQSPAVPRGTPAGALPRAATPRALFADVSLHQPPAPLAHHVAAPVVLAVTPLHHLLRVGVVAAAAAHQVAALAAQGALVALPAERRAQETEVRGRDRAAHPQGAAPAPAGAGLLTEPARRGTGVAGLPTADASSTRGCRNLPHTPLTTLLRDRADRHRALLVPRG